MPKFPDLAEYAAAIGPVIGAVHVNVHASARRAATALAESAGLSPGLLTDLRFALPLRPLTRHSLATVYRYGNAADLDAEIQDQLDQGTLEEDDALRPTAKALEFIDGLYAVHAATTERIWAGRDLGTLADLAGRVLGAAVDSFRSELGGALAAMAPPYEPVGTPPGVLLFNRLAALRYHRADAHAAAWQAAGLTANEIIALEPGPSRDRIEDETNRRAAEPYRALPEPEYFYDGLLTLV
jgi:hypothetical protein